MTQFEMERADAQVMELVNRQHSQKLQLAVFEKMMQEQDQKKAAAREAAALEQLQQRKERRKSRFVRFCHIATAVAVSGLTLAAMAVTAMTGVLPAWFAVSVTAVVAAACGIFAERRCREGKYA